MRFKYKFSHYFGNIFFGTTKNLRDSKIRDRLHICPRHITIFSSEILNLQWASPWNIANIYKLQKSWTEKFWTNTKMSSFFLFHHFFVKKNILVYVSCSNCSTLRHHFSISHFCSNRFFSSFWRNCFCWISWENVLKVVFLLMRSNYDGKEISANSDDDAKAGVTEKQSRKKCFQ